MKNIWLRLTSKTPQFFKRLQRVAGSFIVLCTGIQAIPGVSQRLDNFSTQAIVYAGIAILVAQFAVENTNDLLQP